MHHFQYKENILYCEDVPVPRIAEHVGTPFFLYSHATLAHHFFAFNGAFESFPHLICFSAKSNSNQAVLKLFADLGSGLDIVSGGELFRGLQAGIPPEKIVFSGVGKREDEIKYALSAGILMFNVESFQELDSINRIAGVLGKKAPVAFRVNPDVDPKTHPYISTGLRKNKFGLNKETVLEVYQAAHGYPHIDITGISCHIGSQVTEVAPFVDALKRVRALIQELQDLGIRISYMDLGGGLGITYDQEAPPHPKEYGRAIIDNLKGTDLTLILEPGRVIVGNAGILVTQVLYTKRGEEKDFIVVDAAMNDLMRPSLYNAYHAIKPIDRRDRGTTTADVVGPICESGDFLAKNRTIANVRQSDLLAVMSAGAYGFSMSSNYNSRLRAAEVMVKGTDYHVVRARESYEQLIVGESIPPFLEV